MLTIWSRARQNSGTYRCVCCASDVGHNVQRGTRPRLRSQWALGTHTSGTPCPIDFRAGLTVDAGAGSSRDDAWNKAFELLKEAMDGPHRDLPARESSKSTVKKPQSPAEAILAGLDWNMIQALVGMDLDDDHVLRDQEIRTQQQAYLNNDMAVTPWDHLRLSTLGVDTRVPEWPANTGQDMIHNNLPPQSLWAPPSLRLTALRRRHTWKKLAIQRLSAGLMIHNLLRHANLVRFERSAQSELRKMPPQLREIIQSLNVDTAYEDRCVTLRCLDRSTVPQYFQDVDGDYHAIEHRLNKGIIKQILRRTQTNNDRGEAFAIARICYNLFVSTAPLSLATFNSLLSGFRKWRRPKLVDYVIAALDVHKIRPNEVTCCVILDHYTSTARPNRFSEFVARMRGVDDALMLAEPSITINEASSGRLVRVESTKVLQKVHPTPMVFSALIRGVLRFAGFDRAMDIYYEMKVDGWGLDVQGLTSLLRHCVHRADWEGGLYLWEEINGIKVKSRVSEMALAYQHMLSLCSITGNTTAFNQVLTEVARRGFERKEIIDGATQLTRWAQKSKNYLAPAFTADNVLIAVSDYLDDTKSNTSEAATKYNSENHSSKAEWEQYGDSILESTDAHQPSMSPEEAWATWVEHEFGEGPKNSKK
ncbi:hypothetical protein ACN47E_001312 [Coniothyrium glycines]